MMDVMTKLTAISVPAMLKVQILCMDKLTSHEAAESRGATIVPSPSRTRRECNAQQMRVLNGLKRKKYGGAISTSMRYKPHSLICIQPNLASTTRIRMELRHFRFAQLRQLSLGAYVVNMQNDV